IVVFIVILTGGALFAALAAPLVFSLFPHNPALVAALDHASVPAVSVAPVQWVDTLVTMVPSNAIMAAAQSAMLPLVVFALFLGFALTRIAPARRAMLVEFFQAIADAMIVIVRWVLWVGPLGVYVLTECLLYLAVTAMMLPVALVFGGERLRRFVPALVPAQAVAIST